MVVGSVVHSGGPRITWVLRRRGGIGKYHKQYRMEVRQFQRTNLEIKNQQEDTT
jgi:hypothetical protein